MKNYLRLLYLSMLIAWLPLVAGSQVSFPLKESANKRYLIDQHNTPFPILGRTAWCIISQPVISYQAFIENSLSYGYNSIEMSVICHWAQSYYPPHNGRGDLPFQKRLDGSVWNGSLVYSNVNAESPDLTTPNERYWTFVDSFLVYCESKGVMVFFFPAYLGAIGSNEGWMKELVANDIEKTRAYGAWIANRYKNQKNLVWMILGDQGYFNKEEKKVEAALIAGLKSVPGQQSAHYSAESGSGENSADQVDFGDQMTLNGVYSWGSVSIPALARHGYSHMPIMPAFLLEEPYDEEGPDGNRFNPNAIQPVRRFQWWGWLSTIGGYISGNGYIWPFIKLHWWEKHLNSPGTLDMHRLNDFIKSVHWWELVPSGMNGMKTLITQGAGNDTSTNYVAAAATTDGALLVAYIPPDHSGSITVDLTVLKENVKAYWFDPTSATLTAISGSPFNNKGTQKFTPPGKNNSGYNDWVLKLAASDY